MVTRRTPAVIMGLCFVVACEQPVAPILSLSQHAPLAAAPSDGNGNKLVVSYDLTSAISCGAETITRNDQGWFQARVFGPAANRNVELAVFHGVTTFSNGDGETFVWRDVGPDRYYVDKAGNLILTITGRSTASGGVSREETVVGHVVVNLTSGQVVSIAGNERGRITDLACAALT